MRIVIDLQGAQCESRNRGIGRYSLAMSQAIARNSDHHEVIVVLSSLFPGTIESIRSAFEGLIPHENIKIWHAAGPVDSLHKENEWRKASAEYIREIFLASLKPDVVFVPSLFEGFGDDAVNSIGKVPRDYPVAVTVHDLIPLLQSDIYLKPNPVYEKFYREKIDFLKSADIYLAISDFSYREILDNLPIDPNRVYNTREGADESFREIEVSLDTESALRDKFNLNRGIVMYSGASDERKNHLRLIRAFSMLPENVRSKYQLAIVGKIPKAHQEKFMNFSKICGLINDEVVITDRISDKDLINLYNIGDLFVFPSWHEGFGLPALEAMSCGMPVIAANNTSLPEVVGWEDALFDPFDEKDISRKMLLALSNDEFRENLIRHAATQKNKFSWDESARVAIKSFEDWVKNKNSCEKNEEDYQSRVIQCITSADCSKQSDAELMRMATAIARTFRSDSRRQLLLDISELVQRDAKSGVQRVVRSILFELLNNPPDNYIVAPVYGTPGKPGYRYARQFTAKFLGKPWKDLEDDFIEFFSGDVFFGLDLQHHVVLSNRDFYQELRGSGVHVSFLVHDLLPITLPKAFHESMFNLHAEWLRVLAETDGAVCVSQTVADEYIDWLNIYGPEREHPFLVGWSHNGADIHQSKPSGGIPADAEEKLARMRIRPTFLMVGTIEPRKGQLQALLAFEKLWNAGVDVNLVMVGKHGWDVDLLVELLRIHSEKDQRLFWLEGVTDEYLEEIYASSTALIAASDGEGFGLPLIEAAQHGLPIIARDIPVFREVAGKFASYFSGSDPESMALSISQWLTDWSKGQIVDSSEMPRLTWKESSNRLIDVILGQNWYRKWMPEKDVWRYAGSDERLSSVVGRRKDGTMISTGTSGYMLFGPYIPLGPGSYQILIVGKINGEHLGETYVDVCGAQGTQIFDKKEVRHGDAGELVRLTFKLSKKYNDIEARVWVDSDVDMSVSFVEIKAVG